MSAAAPKEITTTFYRDRPYGVLYAGGDDLFRALVARKNDKTGLYCVREEVTGYGPSKGYISHFLENSSFIHVPAFGVINGLIDLFNRNANYNKSLDEAIDLLAEFERNAIKIDKRPINLCGNSHRQHINRLVVIQPV